MSRYGVWQYGVAGTVNRYGVWQYGVAGTVNRHGVWQYGVTDTVNRYGVWQHGVAGTISPETVNYKASLPSPPTFTPLNRTCSGPETHTVLMDRNNNATLSVDHP